MNSTKTNLKSGVKTNQKEVKFKVSADGHVSLQFINPTLKRIRKENEYNGETRIMQNLSKTFSRSSV